MLLQSNNADVFFDQTTQELRITSVHKYAGFFQSHKIVGAVTVAFFDQISSDASDMPVLSEKHQGVPASLSFLHLPTNLMSPPSTNDKICANKIEDMHSEASKCQRKQQTDCVVQENPSETTESESRVEMQSAEEIVVTGHQKSKPVFPFCLSRSQDIAVPSETSKTIQEEIKSDKSDQLVNNSDKDQSLSINQSSQCASNLSEDQDSLNSDNVRIVVKQEAFEDNTTIEDKTQDTHISNNHESKLLGTSMALAANEQTHKDTAGWFTMTNCDADPKLDADIDACESSSLPNDAIRCRPIVSKLAVRRRQGKSRETSTRVLDCFVCTDVIRTIEELIQHSELHSNNSPDIKCVACNKGFSNIWALKRHANLHFSHTIYNCPLCDRNLYRMENLRHHMKTAHPASEHLFQANLFWQQRSKDVGSKEELFEFRSMDEENNHLKTIVASTENVSAQDSQPLDECLSDQVSKDQPKMPATFSSNQMSNSFATEHLHPSPNNWIINSKNQNCEPAIPISDDSLQSSEDKQNIFSPDLHIQKNLISPHHNSSVLSFLPSASGLIPGSNEQRENHLFSDTLKKNPLSPLRIPRQKQSHEPRKKDIRNFSCSICQKIIQDLPEFMEHVNNHNTVPGPPFTCPVCLKIFHCEINLKQHASNHMLSKLYMCPVCQAEISRIDNFKRHITMCHQIYAKAILENFDSSLYLVSIKGKHKGMMISKQNIPNKGIELGLRKSPQELSNPFSPYPRHPYGMNMGSVSDFSQYIQSMSLPTTPGNYSEHEKDDRVSEPSQLLPPGQVLPFLTGYYNRPIFPQGLSQTQCIPSSTSMDNTFPSKSAAVPLQEKVRGFEPGTLEQSHPDSALKEVLSHLSSHNHLKCSNTSKFSNFYCMFCGSGILDESDLMSHADRHRKSEDKTICPLCLSEFGQEEELKRHCEVHLNSSVCPICDARFNTKDLMLRHLLTCKENMDTQEDKDRPSEDPGESPASFVVKREVTRD